MPGVSCGVDVVVDSTLLDGSDSFTSVLTSSLAISIGWSFVASTSVGMSGVGSLCIAVSAIVLSDDLKDTEVKEMDTSA